MRNNKKHTGFTLLETMVTVAIISLLATLVLANYRGAEKKYALSGAVQRLVADLRRGQNMALAPTLYEGYEPGIGINFNLANPDFYIFFLDKNNNHKFEAGIDLELEKMNLPQRIKISDVSPALKTDIFFEPPDPTIYINQNKSIGITAVIKLEMEGADISKIIKINTSGLIE